MLCRCDDPQSERSRRHRAHRRPAGSRRAVAHPLPRRVSYCESSSLGNSATTSATLTLSRRSSASMADGTGSNMPVTMRRWSGSSAASAATKFNTYDAAMAQTRRAEFTVSGSRISSFSNNPNPNGGDHGSKARTSFFPKPHVGGSRIHHHDDSEDDSSQSATSPARGTNNFVENGEEADENDLELGYGGEPEGRRGEE